MDNSLLKLDKATQLLAEVRSIDDAKELIDLAEAARVYAKQVKLGLEAQNHAAEIKLRAQRRAGEILDTMEKNKGGWIEHNLTLLDESSSCIQPPKYEDIGITYKDAHVWQTLAAMPEPLFERFITDKREAIEEITTAGIYREARRFIAANKNDTHSLPTDKYRIIYADPPWKYGDRLLEGYGPAEFHYPTMDIDEICELPINELAEENAVLFLWVTSPILPQVFDVISAWGFEYKASFIWDKMRHNYGHYNSVRHEFLLLCTRGSCLPDSGELIDSVQSIERNGHSEKPEEFRAIIERLYPTGKRIELFARRKVEKWESWGNE